MTRGTLELFQQLLNGITLSAGAPDFEEWAEKIRIARLELVRELGKEETK